MLIPINLTGATYRSRSLPLSAQVTRNFYPELQEDPNTKSRFVLQPFPGLKLFGTQTGFDRGMLPHKNVLYKVTGQNLYRVDQNGSHTNLGSVPGTQRCILSGIGDNIVLATNGKAYHYNGSSVSEITDADLETPNALAHLNNRIIYDGDGGRFGVSDVGDPTSINSLNYATAESNADDLIRPYTFDQLLYLFGQETIETWYDSGSGNPPFERIQGGIIPVGLGAICSVSNNDSFIYFLGDDNRIYRARGSNAEVISTIAISHAISGFNRFDDAIGFCFTFQGINFYAITFPAGDKTFCYSEQSNQWFELASGISGGRYIASDHAFIYNKNLISDYRNGNIYELDIDTYTENGSVIQRVRDSAPLHGGLINKPGKRLSMRRFELILETGTGLITGQGSDPIIMLSFSDDGGKTFSTEKWGRIGRLGQFQTRVQWHALGSFESRIIRIKTSDPVNYSIHSAAAEIEVGI